MRGSFSEVIEVCGGLLLMGWIELVVYHGAEKPLFDASGHLKGAPGTHDPTCWSPLGSVRMCGNVEFIACSALAEIICIPIRMDLPNTSRRVRLVMIPTFSDL